MNSWSAKTAGRRLFKLAVFLVVAVAPLATVAAISGASSTVTIHANLTPQDKVSHPPNVPCPNGEQLNVLFSISPITGAPSFITVNDTTTFPSFPSGPAQQGLVVYKGSVSGAVSDATAQVPPPGSQYTFVVREYFCGQNIPPTTTTTTTTPPPTTTTVPPTTTTVPTHPVVPPVPPVTPPGVVTPQTPSQTTTGGTVPPNQNPAAIQTPEGTAGRG